MLSKRVGMRQTCYQKSVLWVGMEKLKKLVFTCTQIAPKLVETVN